MAAEAYLVRGVPVADTVAACDNAFHFMHTLKVQRNDREFTSRWWNLA